jgi:hypothetical protein
MFLFDTGSRQLSKTKSIEINEKIKALITYPLGQSFSFIEDVG